MSNRQAISFGCVVLAATLCGGQLLAEDFNSKSCMEQWEFHSGPEFPGADGSIKWSADEGRGGSGCLVLEHSFEAGGNYVQASATVDPGGHAQAARLWLSKPGGHRITIRVVDSAGQTFQKGVTYQAPGWQELEVDLGRWDASFGGPGDHKLRPPIKRFGILIENTASPKAGKLLVDDLEFLSQVPAREVPVTYTALDFTQNPPGHVQGGAGNSIRDGTWKYAFNSGSSPGFGRDFSLLGDPQLMRIHLDSDGSGHGLRVELGSHFQSFHKQVGTLSVKGPQTIEVPLGKLEGWGHFGGANNGVAGLPLRFRRIGLEAGTGPRSGNITIKQIEMVTLPRKGQTVILVPDVRASDEALAGKPPVAQQSGKPPVAQVRFTVKAISLQSAPVTGKLMCDIRDAGKSLARYETTMSLGSAGQPVEWEVTHPMGDHPYLEAVFRWSDPAFTSKPVSIGTCALPEDPGSPDLQPDSFMGAGLYLYRYRHAANYIEPVTRVCKLAQRAGVKWTREEIQWHTTEPAEGQFEWKFYDDVIDTARSHGISVYGLLCYWSNWARKDTPEGVEQYCRWVRQVVRRYKDRVKHWEIWNEPNIFFWSGPHELYAQMLNQAYDAIKAEDPEAMVLGCSTAGIDTAFVKKVMGWGARFDALTIHPYRGAMDDLGFIKELQDARKLVGGREVWLTEIGFPSQLIDGWSERRQASLCARVYLCTAASGAGRTVSWYDFRNDGNDPFYNEMNFGLVRNDLRLKPGYGALATLGGIIGHMQVSETIDIGQDAYAFRFTDGKQDVVAACAPAHTRLLSYRAPDGIKAIDTFGGPILPARNGELATITLDVGLPVYLVGPAGWKFEPTRPDISCSVQPRSTRVGEQVEFSIRADWPVEVLSWDLPQGWPEPQTVSESSWRVVVPRGTPAYEYEIQAVISRGGQVLRLPAQVAVAPAIVRF